MDIDFSKLGAVERPKDERDIQLGTIQAPITIPVEYKTDISWLQRNFQGQQPACGPHSGSHLKAVLDFVITSGTSRNRYTPRYGWIKLKAPGSPVNDGYQITDGTDMRSIFKWLQKIGANSFEPLENDVTLALPSYADPAAVTPGMDQDAGLRKIASYGFTTTDLASLKQAVFLNKAVLLLIKCDEGFWHTKTPTFTTPKWGHFICQFGYDDAGIWVIDSADPDDANAIKHIANEYIQPQFIVEAGTAVNLPPSVVQALTAGQKAIALQILADMGKILELDLQLLKQKVAPQPSTT